MNAIKKLIPTFIGLLFVLPSIAQEKGDLGILISTSETARISLEYRKPIGEKYKFKIGLTQGSTGLNNWGYDGQIVAISDSAVSERNFYKSGSQSGLRIGAERQFGNSMFSIGGDLILGYKNERSTYRYSVKYLQEDGSWNQHSVSSYDPAIEGNLNSSITRHYLVAGARISINMDVPLGGGFLLNLSAASNLGMPIYMGASNVSDPNDFFLGTPPFSIDLTSTFGIGVRYVFGSNPKD